MSTLETKDLLRKLRSNGVKVTLRPRGGNLPGEVSFLHLDKAPLEVRKNVARLGVFIRWQLESEKKIRDARARKRIETIPDTTTDQL